MKGPRLLKPDAISYPPRGMSRELAARYIGVSPSLFDIMVRDGRMPPAKEINARRVWDRFAIDQCFEHLPGGSNPDDDWETEA